MHRSHSVLCSFSCNAFSQHLLLCVTLLMLLLKQVLRSWAVDSLIFEKKIVLCVLLELDGLNLDLFEFEVIGGQWKCNGKSF